MSSSPEEYHLHFLPGILQVPVQWSKTPLGSRFELQIALALSAANENLRTTPLEWGDPLKHYASGEVMEYHRTYYPLHFNYRVDLKNRYVVVHRIHVLLAEQDANGA